MTHIKTIIRIDKTIHSINKKTGEIKETLTIQLLTILSKEIQYFL